MRIFYIKQMSSIAARPSPTEVSKLEACAGLAARMLKLLASEQRLLLLCRLVEGEASVGVLAEHARLAQSTASQHLAKMRAEGLVATRREAQTIYYRLQDPAAMRVLDTLCDIYRGPAAKAAHA
jgi:DNA-binding transcriptional ArsR family regulator